ncbi:hypothetical protein Nepgr_032319 [Nepenthes gracilis]|uniref:Uncharacterized protein n=1 Tax=Nepenthes gracilis TaxID=150966 RepID=A0AAD3TJT2_NEPGR|nr:hypothetical protein Nepgr_032319 [Nepenthes gracilis]
MLPSPGLGDVAKNYEVSLLEENEALLTKFDNTSVAEFTSCFFRVPGVSIAVSRPPSYSIPPKNSPCPLVAASPSRLQFRIPLMGTSIPTASKL